MVITFSKLKPGLIDWMILALVDDQVFNSHSRCTWIPDMSAGRNGPQPTTEAGDDEPRLLGANTATGRPSSPVSQSMGKVSVSPGVS
jgi:hypothetical protein